MVSILWSLIDAAQFGILEKSNNPKTAALLSGLISQCGSAARYRISGIVVRLSDRYVA